MNDQTVQPRRVAPSEFAPRHTRSADGYLGPTPGSPAMRRRVLVYFGVFFLCLLLSLSYTFMRDAVYLANARVQITPAARVLASEPPAATDGRQAFLDEVQRLTSRPLLEKVVKRLREQGHWTSPAVDPVPAAQGMLTVTPLDGTQVVQLQALGTGQALVAPLLNAVIEVYRDEQASAGSAQAQTQLLEARDELRVLESRAAEKKKALEAYKLRADIVSSQRDENQTLARLKGLGTSLSAATDREATAAGRVRAIEQAVTEGKRAPQAKDNPTVAGIEQRLSQMREEWRALERQFTSQYLDMDANARALRTRISNLEQQLEVERQKSQQTALADAREELAGARATAQRLQQQLSDDKHEVQTFSRRFGDYQAMQEEFQGLEQMRQGAARKLLAMQSSESARRPRIQVVEPAATPEAPWRPLYWRDAGISIAASLLLGFLAVWFVEFFNRAEAPAQGPATVIVAPPWLAMDQPLAAHLGGMETLDALAHRHDTPRLPDPLPRELQPDEVDSLLRAAAPQNLAILAGLLCGLSADEVVALRQQHVDTAKGTLTVPGECARVLPLPPPLLAAAAQHPAHAPEAPFFVKTGARPLDQEDVSAVVTSSAHDAALAQPQSITPATLRHTYIAFLVRQGLRFSDLGHLVGRLSAQSLNMLAPLAPDGQRVSLDNVQRLLPALRGLTAHS